MCGMGKEKEFVLLALKLIKCYDNEEQDSNDADAVSIQTHQKRTVDSASARSCSDERVFSRGENMILSQKMKTVPCQRADRPGRRNVFNLRLYCSGTCLYFRHRCIERNSSVRFASTFPFREGKPSLKERGDHVSHANKLTADGWVSSPPAQSSLYHAPR